MANLGSDIYIKAELRPCIVNKKKALFHRWLVEGPDRETFGLIEQENGVVCRCYPHEVRFCDNLAAQYAFNTEPEDEKCL